MNLPLDFDSTAPWQKIVKLGLAVSGIYGIVVVGIAVQGHLLGAGLLLLFGLAFYAVLRRANRVSMGAKGRLTRDSVTVHPVRVWGFSLNVPSGAFSIDRFSAVGVAEHIVVVPTGARSSNSGIVQLVGRPGTPNIQIMIDDIDTARGFAEALSAALSLELQSIAVPGQTIRRYTV